MVARVRLCNFHVGINMTIASLSLPLGENTTQEFRKDAQQLSELTWSHKSSCR